MNSTSAFFNWFTEEINERNADIKAEYITAAQELKAWYQAETGITDELVSGGARRLRRARHPTGTGTLGLGALNTNRHLRAAPTGVGASDRSVIPTRPARTRVDR